jgi:hypothetical protein
MSANTSVRGAALVTLGRLAAVGRTVFWPVDDGGGGESACTPDSVRDLAVRWRPSISAGGYPPAPAAYPGSDGRDHPPPARPCSGWGLPSHPGRPGCWCALTAPFHPYLCGGHTSAGRPVRHRRSALCCTFLRVTPTGRYPASCPAESGRSSDGSPLRRAGPYAAAWPTRHHSPFNHGQSRGDKGDVRWR